MTTTTTTPCKSNLVVNHSPLCINQEYVEQTLLFSILYPFINQYEGLHNECPSYAWQDFILHVYDECFTPLHKDSNGKLKQIVCNALAGLLGLKSKQLTKEQYRLISLYAPYLSQVPRKITLRRTYSSNERSIFTVHPNNNNATLVRNQYHQIIITAPTPAIKTEQKQCPRIKNSQPSILCKRKRETITVDDDDGDDDEQADEREEDEGQRIGKELANADARVVRAIYIYNMAISYHDELLRKAEHHRNVTIPRKQRQIEFYKRQRQDLLDKYKIKK